MNVDWIVDALRQEFPAEKIEPRSGLRSEAHIVLPPDCIHLAVRLLVEQFDLRHLSTITGQDTGSEIELLYHFWDGQGLTLRTLLPGEEPHIATVTDLIPGASFYEREVSEMLHVTFDGHPDPRPLLLPDDWNGEAPLRLRPSVKPPARNTLVPPDGRDASDWPQECAPPKSGEGRMIIPIGPQHAALKEPLSFLLTVEGEQIMDSLLRIGYVHRGIERLCQERSYVQNLHLVERICGICSHVHTTAYCQGVEALLGLEVPQRALYLRTLLCELERIHSHLLWLGVLAENIGFTTIFMYAWRDRELALDIMEELSGGRIAHAANVIGGVRNDVDETQVRAILAQLDELERQVDALLGVIQHERTFQVRTRDVGHLSVEQVRRYCAVGPIARASGVDVDVRRDLPYAAYDQLTFRTVTSHEGDVWARTWVRMQETIESLRLCRQVLSELPEGPITVRAPRRVPPGEAVSRAEAPRGELIYYIRSDGSDKPARVKVRTPTMTALITLRDQMRGINIADVPAVIGGMDLCIACVDR
jgi:NADH-quinone oxidoreductase subunit D